MTLDKSTLPSEADIKNLKSLTSKKISRLVVSQIGNEYGLQLLLENDDSSKSAPSLFRFPVIQFTSNFAVNEIPTANCLVGVGSRWSRSSGINKQTDIDQLMKKIVTNNKVKVILSLKGEYAPAKRWKKELITLFDGRIAGVSPTMTSGSLALNVLIYHWLIDLTSSSALVGDLHPMSGGDLASLAVLNFTKSTIAAPGTPASSFFTTAIADVFKKDIWSGIKTIFNGLCLLKPSSVPASSTFFQASADDKNLTELRQQKSVGMPNIRALLALKKIEGPVDRKVLQNVSGMPDDIKNNIDAWLFDTSLDYDHGVALNFEQGQQGEINIYRNITEVLSNEDISNYADHTLWSKLISICSSFGLAIAPRPTSAFIFAENKLFIPPPYNLKIVKDNLHFEIHHQRERPIRAVVVRTHSLMQTNAPIQNNNVTPKGPIILAGGTYLAPDIKDGLILYISPPPWINMLSFNGVINASNGGVAPAAAALAVKFCNSWAKYIYGSTTLRGCFGTVRSRLRFDVAPGSIVLFRKKLDERIKNKNPSDQLDQDIYAYVNRVVTTISSDPPSAVVTYQVSDVRVKENQSSKEKTASGVPDNLILKEHPLFNDKIHGGGSHWAPLIDDIETSDPDK